MIGINVEQWFKSNEFEKRLDSFLKQKNVDLESLPSDLKNSMSTSGVLAFYVGEVIQVIKANNEQIEKQLIDLGVLPNDSQ